ncbi:hypothetical protein F511_37562 [Dorcoceras hygrometricum]|uniref:Splicing factor 3B subunit 1-like n=1 Tax=Dorcoceras hygrometricum TaxID=472368 RepID=A0A2Z7C4D5_9LAMI|nr:hypothetical protein F511_37562 [Dorcoceras hygrometricum]
MTWNFRSGKISDLEELERFFDTAIVQDGDITCAVSGKYVEISESRFAGVFNLPTDGLSDLSEVPNHLVMQSRTVFARLGTPVPYSCKRSLLKYEFRILNDILEKSITTIDARGDAHEPAVAKVAIIKKKVVSKKRPAVASDAPAVKKKRTKSGKAAQKEEALALTTVAQEAVPLQTIAPSSAVPAKTESAMENVAEEQRVETAVDAVDQIIAQVISETADMETDERELDMVDQSSGTDVIMEETENKSDDSTTADYFVTEPLEATEKGPSTEIADIAPTVDGKTSDEESMYIDDLLATIPNESTLPSSAGVVTKIQFGKSIEIREFEEGDWYKTRLPKIPAADKGKAPLSEKDPIKWHPAWEIFSLICADIDLLIKLRERVIEEVDKFFNSFSFSRLAVLKLEDIYDKEEQVLTWGTKQIPLRSLVNGAFVDLIVLDMLSDVHRVVLEELRTQMQVHGLTCEMTCYSILFEGDKRHRGAVIARSNTSTRCKFLAVVSNGEVRDVPVDQTEFFGTFRRGLDVQIVLSDSSSRSSSSHELMDFHVNIPSNEETSVTQFDSLVDPPVGTDTPVDQISLPTALTTDAAESFTTLRASISWIFVNHEKDSRRLGDSQSKILFKIDHLEKTFVDALTQQDLALRSLIKSVRQEAQNQANVSSIEIKSIRAQNALLLTDLADTRKELYLVDYITRRGDAKKGESGSSSRPQPPPMIKTEVLVVVDVIGVDLLENDISAMVVDLRGEVLNTGLEENNQFLFFQFAVQTFCTQHMSFIKF